MKILVVDDNLITKVVVKKTLLNSFDQVDYASNGKEAFELWKNNRYDIVVTDLHMPIKDGFEFVKDMRDYARNHYTYIVVLTSDMYFSDSHFLMCDDYITKPYRAAELISRVELGAEVLNSINSLKENQSRKNINYTELVKKVLLEFLTILHSSKEYNNYTTKLNTSPFLQAIEHYRPDILNSFTNDNPCELLDKKDPNHVDHIRNHIAAKVLYHMEYHNILPEVFSILRDISQNRYEKYDGTGPQSKKGNEIPIASRIMQIVECYVLQSSNVFSKTIETDLFNDQQSTHFDPLLTTIFMQNKINFDKIIKEFL